MLFTLFAAVLILVGQPLSVPGATVPHGTVATYHQHHTVSPSGLHDDRSGWTYSFPVSIRAEHPAVRHPASRSHRAAHHPSARRRAPARPGYRYQAWMLVTYYTWTGNPMANGLMPSIGWAACGYELSLGTRVGVPGVGILTCGDRMCNTCPGIPFIRHIDVYGIPLGTSKRWVTVY